MNPISSHCQEIRPLLFELDDDIDGILCDDERQQIEQHLLNCESCRQWRQAEQQLTGLLTGAGATTVLQLARTDTTRTETTRDGKNGNRWRYLAAVAAMLAMMVTFWYAQGQSPYHKLPDELAELNAEPTSDFYGSILSKPVIHNASFRSTPALLKSTNHIQLPVGAAVTISLNQTGTLNAIGPATLELDRIGLSWKVTLLEGEIVISVEFEQSIQVAGRGGTTWIEQGVHRVHADSAPAIQSDQATQQTEDDDEAKLASLFSRGMAVFQADSDSGVEPMREAADLLGQVIEHPLATLTQKYSAGVYRVAALANSKQPERGVGGWHRLEGSLRGQFRSRMPDCGSHPCRTRQPRRISTTTKRDVGKKPRLGLPRDDS